MPVLAMSTILRLPRWRFDALSLGISIDLARDNRTRWQIAQLIRLFLSRIDRFDDDLNVNDSISIRNNIELSDST
jgi:hypothetical protein